MYISIIPNITNKLKLMTIYICSIQLLHCKNSTLLLIIVTLLNSLTESDLETKLPQNKDQH